MKGKEVYLTQDCDGDSSDLSSLDNGETNRCTQNDDFELDFSDDDGTTEFSTTDHSVLQPNYQVMVSSNAFFFEKVSCR